MPLIANDVAEGLLLTDKVTGEIFPKSWKMKLVKQWLFAAASLIISSTNAAPQATSLPSSAVSSATSTSYRPKFTAPASTNDGVSRIPTIQDPEAIDTQAVCPGYILTGLQNTTNGFKANLNLGGNPCNVYGNDVQSLSLTVDVQASDRLRVYIVPSQLSAANESFYVLPDSLVRLPATSNGTISNAALAFSYSNTPTFSFNITRRATGDVLFSTTSTKLVYSDQHIQLKTSLPAFYNIYGLGEVIHSLRLNRNLSKLSQPVLSNLDLTSMDVDFYVDRTIFASDAGDPIDGNIYGSHPVYYETRYFDGNNNLVTDNATGVNTISRSHGVYLRNAHPMAVLLRDTSLTYNLLGGALDLYFFAGPSIKDVATSYQRDAIGFPAEQQFWTLGYHQCRWGYQNWSVMQDVFDNFMRYEIPVQTLWNDIDYMQGYRDFTNDPNTFPANDSFVSRLLATGRHYVPIVDSAVYIPDPNNASDAYTPYNHGHDVGAFMLNPDGSEYIGAVWPGYTVFPDWFSPNTTSWWITEISDWHKQVPFSGIWIDMSEVSSFCVGSCGSKNLSLQPVHPYFKLSNEPYNIPYDYPEGFNVTNATDYSSIVSLSNAQYSATATPSSSSSSVTSTQTSIPSASSDPSSVASVQTTTTSTSSSTSYLRTKPTLGAGRNVLYPPYVLDSTNGPDLAGHAVAANATHHNGMVEYDVHNLFGHYILKNTYQALLALNATERPFIVGRSTFAGSGRWSAHWGGDNSALWAYLYFSIPQVLSFSLFGMPMMGPDTCGFNGNTDEELCNRWMQLSAFFTFYRNHNTIGTIGQEPYQWASVIEASKTAMRIRYSMLNYMYTLMHNAHISGSMVTRALAWEFPNEPRLAGADRQFLLGPAVMIIPVLVQGVRSVNGVFPGYAQQTKWYDYYNQSAVPLTSSNVTISAPLGHIPLFIRGGYVVPLQQPGLTTDAVRASPWSLLVALATNGTASGSLYLDDGVSISPPATKTVTFSATNGSLSASVSGTYSDGNALANITVLGVSRAPTMATYQSRNLTIAYNTTSQVLVISNFNISQAFAQSWNITWS